MTWDPKIAQMDIPYPTVGAKVIKEDTARNLVVYEIICRTDLRLKDGILNLPQAYYPLLTGLVCGAILGWVFRWRPNRAAKSKQ